jgi:hypothetical protein
MKNHGRQKQTHQACNPETTAVMVSANKRLQRTRGTARAASVSAVALALEAERYIYRR